jgi:hypothetical protein
MQPNARNPGPPSDGARILAAADPIVELLARRLGEGREVDAVDIIAAAARMAGTMLFRSFGLDTSGMEPGAAILSEQANEKGPGLINIVFAMLERMGVAVDRSKLNSGRVHPPTMTVLEMQALLDDELLAIERQHGLPHEACAQACAVATAWLIKQCAPQIGAEAGVDLALYGMIEGSKTVPRPLPPPAF